MTNILHILCTLGFLLSLGSFAEAKTYSMKVFAEPGAEERALEFIEKIKLLEPFKQLHEKGIFKISDQPHIARSTKCRGGNMGIERLASCNTALLMPACLGNSLCPLFTSVPAIGAGGSPFPVSSSSFPWTTMLHEVIHTFGFADEYAYSADEVGKYCSKSKRDPNEHQQAKAQIFKTEAEATNACVKEISWCKQAVDSGSKVASQKSDGKWIIGSPLPDRCPDNTLGVYLGAGCLKNSPESDYRPYFCPTVMGFPTIGQDNCEVQERHGIIGRMPNVLPTYYQQVLFAKIAGRGLSFKETSEDFPLDFSYGIPEVDALAQGNTSQGNRCSKNRK